MPIREIQADHDSIPLPVVLSDSTHFPLDALLPQTDDNLARGFRAIKMKAGRPSLRDDVERVRATRAHLGPEFPRMVDANMRRWLLQEERAGVVFDRDSPAA